MSSSNGRAIALVLLVTASATFGCDVAPTAAQDWRTITTQRQYAGEKKLDLELTYGAGRLSVQPGTPGSLYKATLKYDADMFKPVNSYHEGLLKVGVDDFRHVRGRHNSNAGRLDVALSTDVPLDLQLKFGAVEAQLELGGLRITHAQVSTGASQTALRFSRPNLEHCDELKFEVGAAEFKAYGLGNANAEHLEVQGGVGDILLDFTGEWKTDMDAEVNLGLGQLTMQVPRGVGVRVIKNSMLASFDHDGLNKQGNTYTSSNFKDARHKLTIKLDAAFGSVHIEWVDGIAAGM
jgi:hypothetical protein